MDGVEALRRQRLAALGHGVRLALKLGEHRLAEHRAAEAVEQVPGEERLRLFVILVALHQRAQNEDLVGRRGHLGHEQRVFRVQIGLTFVAQIGMR